LCAAADASSLPRHPQASAFGSKRFPSPGAAILAGAVFLAAAQLLPRAAAVSTADTNQSDPCATAHDQSRLGGPNFRAGGGRDRPAFPSPLHAICWPFAWHSGALKGNASCRLVGLVGMNEVADATGRSADCHPGADAAARGAMGTIDSSIRVAYQTEFKPHTRPRSIRARPSGRATSRPPSRFQ
jgi:hypothetical protein